MRGTTNKFCVLHQVWLNAALVEHVHMMNLSCFYSYTHSNVAVRQDLKSGILLCELVNKLSPGVVKKVHLSEPFANLRRIYDLWPSLQVNRSTMPFAQRENIHAFCEAAKSLGVKDINNFTADDLFEVIEIFRI